MTEKKPFLSICIPTRNRAAFLYRTLRSITETPVFQNGNDIEIVVSDNASTDATREVAALFTRKYPDKIVYSRNEEDIADKNFEKSLSLGNGEFLKLNNDTFWFDGDGLEKMLSDVKKYAEDRPVLFFTNDKNGRETVCADMNEFVRNASYTVTWLGSFGIWKTDFDRITDFSKNADTQLAQTDVLFREITRRGKAVILPEQYTKYQFVWNKPKYDVSKIFGEYYPDFLQSYVESGVVSKSVFKKEKQRVLRHIFNYYFSFNMAGNDLEFFDGLKKHYAFNLFFYLKLVAFLSNHLIKKLIYWWKIKRRGVDGNFRKQWRKRNPAASVVPLKFDCLNSIYAGNGAIGELNIENCDPEKNTLIIGELVKIGKDVRFVFNGAGKMIFVADGTEIPDGTTVYPDTGRGSAL